MANNTEVIESGKTILESGKEQVKEASVYVKDFIANLGVQFPDYLYGVLTIFIGAFLIWVATKLTNKIAKTIMVVLGIILIIGIVLSFLAV